MSCTDGKDLDAPQCFTPFGHSPPSIGRPFPWRRRPHQCLRGSDLAVVLHFQPRLIAAEASMRRSNQTHMSLFAEEEYHFAKH